LVQSIAGGGERSARTEQAQQQGLSLLAITPLLTSGQGGRRKLSAAGAWDVQFDGHGSDQQGAGIIAVGFVLGSVLEIGAAFGMDQARQQRSQKLAHTEIAQAGLQEFLDFRFF